MSKVRALYKKYRQHLSEIADIKYSAAVLQWDQETYLPPKGNDARGRQISTLTALSHQKFTDEFTGNLLIELLSLDGLGEKEKRNVELSYEDYCKNKKLPAEFVRKSTETINQSFHSWISARKQNDFSHFSNDLESVIENKIKETEFLGYENHPYDALLNEYDKGLTVQTCDQLFESLSKELKEILNKINKKPQVDNSFLFQKFDQKKQWDVGIDILKQMHFDFDAGRQDLSEHPFTTNFCSKDVRLTTRIDENDLGNMIWSCIHEGGHGLYEQGLPENEYGLPLGEYCSLSIHESQSRLWENCIGRSLCFWQSHLPKLAKYFPDQMKKITPELFFKGINKVEPSLIRTEADELTYHFHVIIRYEIEKKLIEKSITSKDIPAIWNEYYNNYLGVNVLDDKNGCLQDVHWSHGSFGYFPTYSIGSLYAAQFWERIKIEQPEIEKEISLGNTINIIHWLQQHIYPYGRFYPSNELCEKATGEKLNTNHFLNYIKEKYNYIYTM